MQTLEKVWLNLKVYFCKLLSPTAQVHSHKLSNSLKLSPSLMFTSGFVYIKFGDLKIWQFINQGFIQALSRSDYRI